MSSAHALVALLSHIVPADVPKLDVCMDLPRPVVLLVRHEIAGRSYTDSIGVLAARNA